MFSCPDVLLVIVRQVNPNCIGEGGGAGAVRRGAVRHGEVREGAAAARWSLRAWEGGVR